jgi:DNA (cytosine-5)-methyltransferase 1
MSSQGQRKPHIKALDFFCGAGGLTRGLLDAGIDVRAGIDNDDRLRETYEANNSPSTFVAKDIRHLDIHELRKGAGIGSDDLVLYAACTPCQPFSTLNQRRGRDNRKSLLLRFGEIVKASPPDFIVVENVPGLNNAYGRDIYRSFIKMLDEAGFKHTDGDMLDAQDFGVPQIRKRFLMVASRRGEIRLPRRLGGTPKTVRDAIGHFPPPQEGIVGVKSRNAKSANTYFPGRKKKLPNHIARSLGRQHERIMAAIPANGGSRSEVTDKRVLLACHRRTPKLHKDVFGRMSWDGPAPTLTCRCTDVYCGRFAHPRLNRGLSLREAAAIQTFPDDYEFFGTFFHAAQQIGNAVPVRLARRLGMQVITAARVL